MNFSGLSNYINQSNEIAVAIKPTYVNKTNVADQLSSVLMGSAKQNNYFVWVYKIIISNESEYELTMTKYDLTTISEVGIVRKILPEQSQLKLLNIGLKIKPKSVFETNDIILLNSRSGILYGECVFSNKKTDIERVIKIAPVSLDSGDSKKMAN